MKIINKVQGCNGFIFLTIEVGEVFRETDSNQFWIKMPISYKSDEENSKKYNAYNIYNKSYGYFYDNELVFPLNAELTISRR